MNLIKLVEQYEELMKKNKEVYILILNKKREGLDPSKDKDDFWENNRNIKALKKLLIQQIKKHSPMADYIRYKNILYVIGDDLLRIDLDNIEEIK